MEVGPPEDWRYGEVVLDPPPASQPIFRLPPKSTSSTPLWPVQQIIDGAFFGVATGLVLWLGWVVVAIGIDSWFVLGSVVLFWFLLAYVGLPEVQEVLTRIYLPDYFIGRSITAIGVLGDPINLALNGTEADIHSAMTRAGWVRADELTVRSSWRIVLSSALRRPYRVPRSPRCSSSTSARPSPTSRRSTARPHNVTTCASGRCPRDGCCQAGSGSAGWHRPPTTKQSGCPCSPSSPPTASMPTST